MQDARGLRAFDLTKRVPPVGMDPPREESGKNQSDNEAFEYKIGGLAFGTSLNTHEWRQHSLVAIATLSYLVEWEETTKYSFSIRGGNGKGKGSQEL